jgi:hypothetical protein
MRTYSLASILVIGISVPTAQATLIQATYQISASNFQDSNSNPSVAPTSTVVTGSYQFTFDTQFVVQIGIVPDPGGSTTALGNILEIVNSNNSVIGFDQTNSGVTTDVNIFTNVADITIGGTLNGVDSLVGLSDDFSTRFRISLIDFEVSSVIENFGFVTTVDPFYQGPTTVSLVSVSILPEPNTAVLLGIGLVGLGMQRNVRGRAIHP